MNEYIDLQRIGELEDALGADAAAIAGSMLQNMTAAIEELEAALAAGELDRATQAAHRCRNDALMLGARELLAALTDARGGDARLGRIRRRRRARARESTCGRRPATSWPAGANPP